jgi:hypothetical protein
MTIYVDRSAVLGSDAAGRLIHLVEAGHRLVRVDASGIGPTELAGEVWSDHVAVLPAEPPRGSWFVTADPATCGDHQPGLRTMLIGPRAETVRPTRCDATARDLRDAVLEILSSDAMG